MSIFQTVEKLLNSGVKASTIIQRLRKDKNFAKPMAKAIGYGYTPDMIVDRIMSMGERQVEAGTTPEIRAAQERGGIVQPEFAEKSKRFVKGAAKLAGTAIAATQIPRAIGAAAAGLEALGGAAPAQAMSAASGAPPVAPAIAQIGMSTKPIPAARRLQTTAPISGGATIPLGPPGGLTPHQAKVARMPAQQQVIPSGSPIALPQQTVDEEEQLEAETMTPEEIAQSDQMMAKAMRLPTKEEMQITETSPKVEPERFLQDFPQLDDYTRKQLKQGKSPTAIYTLLKSAKAFAGLVERYESGGQSYFTRIRELVDEMGGGKKQKREPKDLLGKAMKTQARQSADDAELKAFLSAVEGFRR